MAEYLLEIITPERSFFCEMVESVIVPAPDGEMAIMRGHEQLIISIDPGTLKIRQGSGWKYCTVAPGFVEVLPHETIIFTQSAEWPEEIDMCRAEEERCRAEERLRQKLSHREYVMSKVSLAHAMARIQLSKTRKDI